MKCASFLLRCSTDLLLSDLSTYGLPIPSGFPESMIPPADEPIPEEEGVLQEEGNSVQVVPGSRLPLPHDGPLIGMESSRTESGQSLQASRVRTAGLRRRNVQSVRRVLFDVDKGSINHEENVKFMEDEMRKVCREASDRWNFDFAQGRPIRSSGSRYPWSVLRDPPASPSKTQATKDPSDSRSELQETGTAAASLPRVQNEESDSKTINPSKSGEPSASSVHPKSVVTGGTSSQTSDNEEGERTKRKTKKRSSSESGESADYFIAAR